MILVRLVSVLGTVSFNPSHNPLGWVLIFRFINKLGEVLADEVTCPKSHSLENGRAGT